MVRLAHLITRIANAALDQYIRVAILEGMAGVTPYTWGRDPRRGLALAQQTLGSAVDPEWFNRQDQGFYKAMISTALTVLKNREQANDVVGDILANLSRAQSVTGGQLYDMGKKNPTMSPALAQNLLRKHVRHRCLDALSLLRNKKDLSLTDQDEEGGVSVRDLATSVNSDDVINLFIEFMASPEGGNIYKTIRNNIERRWASSPSKLMLFDAFVKYPNLSDTEIARALGHGEMDPEPWINRGAATYVSKTRRELRALIPEIIEAHPAILRDLDLAQEMSSLGYGHARMARTLLAFFRRVQGKSPRP